MVNGSPVRRQMKKPFLGGKGFENQYPSGCRSSWKSTWLISIKS